MDEKEGDFISISIKQNVIVFILSIIPFFMLVIPIIDILTMSIVIFPTDAFGNSIDAHTNQKRGGNPEIEDFTFDKNAMMMTCFLREGVSLPMIFISMYLDNTGEPLDLSGYESVLLRITEATNKKAVIFIKTFVEGFSEKKPINPVTLRHNQYILQRVPQQEEYSIRLEEFEIPSWWRDCMSVNGKPVPEETFDEVYGFDMYFNPEESDNTFGKRGHITIEKIVFHRPMSSAGILISCIVALYCLTFCVIVAAKKNKRAEKKLPRQKPLAIVSYRNKELQRIESFIESHYNNPGISTGMVYKRLGIPASRVFRLCLEEYNLTFKQLINTMRIKEAKRLLRETDLRIIDIALNLGFNDISYFNKLFKKQEHVSPSGYRKKRE
ncbi:MAG: helix-turn-helix transcriptional regulator [Spirochaetales bacterium]|nr:helix-turn-helix transcriptional regulator [Spirochaetales bacterium]